MQLYHPHSCKNNQLNSQVLRMNYAAEGNCNGKKRTPLELRRDLRTVLYPRVYLPLFITRANLLLMLSAFFFCTDESNQVKASKTQKKGKTPSTGTNRLLDGRHENRRGCDEKAKSVRCSDAESQGSRRSHLHQGRSFFGHDRIRRRVVNPYNSDDKNDNIYFECFKNKS